MKNIQIFTFFRVRKNNQAERKAVGTHSFQSRLFVPLAINTLTYMHALINCSWMYTHSGPPLIYQHSCDHSTPLPPLLSAVNHRTNNYMCLFHQMHLSPWDHPYKFKFHFQKGFKCLTFTRGKNTNYSKLNLMRGKRIDGCYEEVIDVL